MTANDPEVIVVGAGPTGLTLACSLRLHGLSVRVLDRAPGPATTSRANFLHARGSEVLGRIGALGRLPDESLRAMRITNYLGDRPVMTLEFGDPGMRTAAPPMVVSQAKVEAALRDRLAQLGVEPEWGRAVVGVRQDGDTAVAELGDGEEIRAPWIVGCDGTSSVTRQQAGIAFPGVKLSERFLLADVHLDWDVDRGGTSGWIHPDGILGAMPMPSNGTASGSNNLWRLWEFAPDVDDYQTAIAPTFGARSRQGVAEQRGDDPSFVTTKIAPWLRSWSPGMPSQPIWTAVVFGCGC